MVCKLRAAERRAKFQSFNYFSSIACIVATVKKNRLNVRRFFWFAHWLLRKVLWMTTYYFSAEQNLKIITIQCCANRRLLMSDSYCSFAGLKRQRMQSDRCNLHLLLLIYWLTFVQLIQRLLTFQCRLMNNSPLGVLIALHAEIRNYPRIGILHLLLLICKQDKLLNSKVVCAFSVLCFAGINIHVHETQKWNKQNDRSRKSWGFVGPR